QPVPLDDDGRSSPDRRRSGRAARAQRNPRPCLRIPSSPGEEMMSDVFRVEGLSKSFGGLAVSRNISLAMQAGERLALIGPNGAGKTTFVDLVTGQLKPDAGRVILNG